MRNFTVRRQHDLIWINRCVWAYFFLLIFEGALRKWVLPSAASVLLLVRDPIVLFAYFLAWRSGVFPRNAFVSVGLALGFISLAVGVFVPGNTLFVALYGFRSNFLQLPFIFLIFKAFDARDVRRVGYWTLWIAVGMGILMVVQFSSPPSSWINSGSDDSFGQLSSAMGRIRAPGTFSFISGPASFFPIVVAFLLSNSFARTYPAWLVGAATIATISAAAVSGSRSVVLAIVIVFVCGLLVSVVLKPTLALRWIGGAVVIGVVIILMSNISFFQDGLTVFSQRMSNASAAESSSGGASGRFFDGYLRALPLLYDVPLWGYGLGVGTNVGAVLLSGHAQFLLSEGEWGRILSESGPLLGGAFLLYRLTLAGWIGACAVRHTARRDPLAVLLFGSGFLAIISGGMGQTTALGFIIFVSGLCLASMRAPTARALTTAAPASPSPQTVAASQD